MSQAAGATTKRGRAEEDSGARAELLAATEACLRESGYSGLSTRRVAESAGMPLSQIHYHFGSKEGLVLALLEDQNRRLLQRQRATFYADVPLSKRWDQACDFLDADIASGYVRVLQEMIAASWSNPRVAAAVRNFVRGWYDVLTDIAVEAAGKFGSLGPFMPAEVACLVGHAFLGSEAMLLLGIESKPIPIRKALRKFGKLIRQLETTVENGG
jgi:AcrR family transcriptional regulator